MMKSNSKILITGSTGFIGYRLTLKLLEKGKVDLRCFARPGSSVEKLKSLRDNFPEAKIDIFIGNLTTLKDAQRAVEDVDIIYNCAAAKAGPIAFMYLNTVVATKNLLEATVRRNIIKRFIHVSSFAVYGVANLPQGTIINEKIPLEAKLKKRNDAYTYTKLRQENLVRRYGEEHNLPFVIVRPGVVYGPGGDEISRRIGLNLFGVFLNIGKNNLLPLSYVDNCADAIVLAGTVPGIEGEVFNIHDNELCTCNDFLQLYLAKVRNIRNIKVPYPVFLVFSWLVDAYSRYSKGQIPPVLNPYKTASTWKGNRFDNRKSIEMLGWTQAISTKVGLEKHFEYFRRSHRSE